MEQLPLSSSGIQSTSSEALQAGLSEPGEEASGGGIEPASPRSTAEPLPLRRSTRARKPQNHSHSDAPPVPASRRIGSSSEGRK
ncbi:hypothetical protein MRX96_024692 [Rhipicephalus microplus]